MKRLRYLLTVIAVLGILSVSAQYRAQLPSTEFHSTSTMVGAGSMLPQAANTGVYITGSTVGSYTPVRYSPRPRRAGEDEGFDENEGEEPVNGLPGEPDPLGDVVWPLMLLALGYVGVRVVRRKKRNEL